VVARPARDADLNIDFQATSKLADQVMKLAFAFCEANENYATGHPATVGPQVTNTVSVPFMDLAPAISVRENERGVGAGSNPQYHRAIDRYSTFSAGISASAS
jgi:hypothetical protein